MMPRPKRSLPHRRPSARRLNMRAKEFPNFVLNTCRQHGPALVDPRTSAVGREMQAQKEKVITQQNNRKQKQDRVAASARKVGLNPAAVADSRALEMLNQALANESE